MKYIIFVLLLISLSADAQKKVLIEKFTNTSCGNCPNASLVLQDIVSRYDDVIWVSHYKNNGWFDNPLTNDQTAQLWEDISVPGNPLGMIDRIPVDDFLLLASSRWEDRIEEQLAESAQADVIIDNVEYDKESRTISFTVRVTFIEDMPEGDYRISAMIVEDRVTGQAQNSYYNDVAGHPLEGRGNPIWNYEHHNVVRAILDDTWGTAEVIADMPLSMEDYSHTYSYTVPEDYKPSMMKIVCMVTAFDEEELHNREIFNADEVSLSDLDLQLTSTSQFLGDNNFTIYPNPVASKLTIATEYNSVTYSIMDVQGKVLEKDRLESGNTIDITHLGNGIYLLMLDENSESRVIKFSVIR
jgi:hypothetical protein